MQHHTASTSAPEPPSDIYSGFQVLTIDRAGFGEWLPISTALLLTRKGLGTLRADSAATLLLFLDEE